LEVQVKYLILDYNPQTRKIKLGKFLENLSIDQILDILDKDLIQKQMNLSQKLEASFSIVKEDIKKIFEELKTTILGEHGLEKIDEFFKEFFNKFQQEAMQEAEKYEKVILN
jgi:hypothetical protein